MPLNRVTESLYNHLTELSSSGRAKGNEKIITAVKPAAGKFGPRYYLKDQGKKEFIKMNSNSYLGMSLRAEVIAAEEVAVRQYGVGPGAVRFISGTYKPHVDLEEKLAAFHNRQAAMLFSSAYATSLGVIVPLTTSDTILISDELNHNCIINAMRLARPVEKAIYKHGDTTDLKSKISASIGKGNRALVITDGIFSMRGDHAPLKEMADIVHQYNDQFAEGIILMIDDSHGVGAFGKTGRGTEEYTDAKADIVIGTLGKAFGVNGGYVVSEQTIITFLRETAPMYIYSNPITVSEAAAALKALEILDSPAGLKILDHLHELTRRFRRGLVDLGFETIPGEHPVVPLMTRDTQKTKELVSYLTKNGILATGLSFPVVPRGDEEIRFQVCADHTRADIDYVLETLRAYKRS
jgi:glycine C-acetyltransferase